MRTCTIPQIKWGSPLKPATTCYPAQWDGLSSGLPVAAFSHAPMRNIGFLGRWGTHACPQCLPSDTVPIRSWTWTLTTLRPSDIRHRHLPCHAMPSFTFSSYCFVLAVGPGGFALGLVHQHWALSSFFDHHAYVQIIQLQSSQVSSFFDHYIYSSPV